MTSRAEHIGLAHGNDLILTSIKTYEDARRMAKAFYPDADTYTTTMAILRNACSQEFAGWRKDGKALRFFGRPTLYSPLVPMF